MADSTDEDEPFREPSGGFKNILSRWNKNAAEQEAHIANNPNHIAHKAFKKAIANPPARKMNPLRSSVPILSSTMEAASLEDPSPPPAKELRSSMFSTTTTAPLVAAAEEEDAAEKTEKSTTPAPAPPKGGGIKDRIGMFNKKTEPPFGRNASTLYRPKKQVPPEPEQEEPLKKVHPPSRRSPAIHQEAPIQTELEQEKEEPPEEKPQRSTSKQNWLKLKTVGLAARATIRLTLRKNRQEMPKNIYQKPLFAQPDFEPPKFHHSDDEIESINKALQKNFVFSDLGQKELIPFMEAFEKCTFKAGEVIITQGDKGDYFYIIYRGKVVFEVNGKKVGKAGKGNSFGELALLYTCPRAATVTAYKDATLFRVDQNTFRYILQNQTKKSLQEKLDLLRGIEFFSQLSNYDLEKLSKVMVPVVFSPGDYVVRKGEMGNEFYVIQEGEILIKDISVGSTTYADQRLGPGEYFGERSLTTSEPRAANAVASTYGVAFSIDGPTFQRKLGEISVLMKRAQDGRKLAGVPLLHSAGLSMKQFWAMAQSIKDISFQAGKTVCKKDELTTPALYFVREGRVEVQEKEKVKEILPGGYFGETLLSFAARNRLPSVPSPITVTCTAKTKLGELRLTKCRSIFDVELLAGRSSEAVSMGEIECECNEEDELVKRLASENQLTEEFKPPPRPKVKLEDLDKIKLLGAGTFGQVWMVSDKNTEEKTTYALKVQTKHDLVEEGQVESVIQERNIMSKVFHPFIVDFITSFQDEKFVYMVVHLIQGGELFSRVHDVENNADGIPEHQAKFYALCIADALAYLHRQNYVFRDLKSENVMIDSHGYPKLIDFGFAKYITEKTFTLCGTPGYLPPEIVMTRGHDWSADHWSFGVLIYDMLTGSNPFFYEGMDQMALFHAIVEEPYDEPKGASPEAKDMISKLLVKEPDHRLGSLSRGEEDILEHPWFAFLDLGKLRQRQTPAPWVPKVKDPLDSSCFDDWDHLVDKMVENIPDLEPNDAALFDKF